MTDAHDPLTAEELDIVDTCADREELAGLDRSTLTPATVRRLVAMARRAIESEGLLSRNSELLLFVSQSLLAKEILAIELEAALQMIGKHPCWAQTKGGPKWHCGECASCVANEALQT